MLYKRTGRERVVMERAKKDLKKVFEKYKNEGLPLEEALSKTIADVRERHEKETFTEALKGFLKELSETYKIENLTEVDPLVSLSEAIFEEYEILLAKVRALFGGREER
jgi:hypothetical protein